MALCVGKTIDSWLYVPETIEYGKKRREFIMNWFKEHPTGGYAVNCKYRPQVHKDPDLKKLIKNGSLVVVREGRAGKQLSSCRRTYLVAGNK